MAIERMSALDAGFFFVDDTTNPMHVGSVTVFEGPPPSYGDVVRLLLAKLDGVPRYRQRVRTLPFSFGRPVWADDEHFQILYHMRHTAVPSPGGAEELRNLAGRVFEQRLDRGKPLWEMWLVEGLADGRWAIISKVHHCMVDGVAGADLMSTLFDLTPEAQAPEPGDWAPEPGPSALSLVADSLVASVSEPLGQIRRGVPMIARRALASREILDFGRGLPATARRMVAPLAGSLTGPIGPHRRWAWAEADLTMVKRIRQATGATINDVILGAVTHGFRALLTSRGEEVDGRSVRTLVPVSIRTEGEKGLLTNRVSAVLANLPVGEPDPLVRLASIQEQMTELKNTRQAVGAEALTGLFGFTAPTLLSLAGRVAFRLPTQPLIQTITTNVPGPRFPLYVLGRKMCELYPYVPIGSTVRISVGIFSYLDRLYFGINADFDGVPDLDVLTGAVHDGFAALHAASVPAGSGPPAATGS